MSPSPVRRRSRHRRHGLAAAAVSAALGMTLAACGGGSTAGQSDETGTGSESAEETTSSATEATPSRVAVTYEDGGAILDGETLEVLETYDTEEFTRLNAFGDGRHLLLTTSQGFQVVDTVEPALTETVFAADAAGHVVRHANRTVLFADGTGETTILDTDALLEGDGDPEDAQDAGAATYQADEAHHGVSIVLEDGTLLTTLGDEDSRSGAMALAEQDGSWSEIARNEKCPGVHGEGTAAGEAVVFGCEDGALLYRDGSFEKLQAEDEYGRMGNAYVSESSPLVVGDYQADPDYEGYELTEVALIDTESGSFSTAELPDGVAYTWRGVVRGPADQAFVLGTDGSIHVMDPATGELGESWPVIEAWEGPDDWQVPHPGLTVHDDTAYVGDPARNQVHAVDLTTGEVTASVTLDAAPNELAVNLG
ncbi:hypothetical protein KLP28_02970 [Nocardioidaceae bacterium]|nr:hypothetical protein KLP28_02970 [Nocardioidaceae bacterium]